MFYTSIAKWDGIMILDLSQLKPFSIKFVGKCGPSETKALTQIDTKFE